MLQRQSKTCTAMAFYITTGIWDMFKSQQAYSNLVNKLLSL